MNTIIIGLKSGRAMAPPALPLPPALHTHTFNMWVRCAYLINLQKLDICVTLTKELVLIKTIARTCVLNNRGEVFQNHAPKHLVTELILN